MFYSETRLTNWIERIKNEDMSLEKGLDVFDKMLEDFIIASMKLLESIKARETTKKEALDQVSKFRGIINRNFDLGDEMKNEIFNMIREDIKLILRGLEMAIERKFSKKSPKKLFEEAVKKEKNGDINGAFENLAKIAARVLSGEKIDDIDVPEEDLSVIGWLDAIDAANTILLLKEIDRCEDEQD